MKSFSKARTLSAHLSECNFFFFVSVYDLRQRVESWYRGFLDLNSEMILELSSSEFGSFQQFERNMLLKSAFKDSVPGEL